MIRKILPTCMATAIIIMVIISISSCKTCKCPAYGRNVPEAPGGLINKSYRTG